MENNSGRKYQLYTAQEREEWGIKDFIHSEGKDFSKLEEQQHKKEGKF